MYDDLLELTIPVSVELIGFADDIAIVATAHNNELLKSLVNPVLTTISE